MAEIIEITDISAKELDIYARLTEARLRAEGGLFIAESEKVIKCALDAGCEAVSLLMERKFIEGKGRDIISRCAVPVYTADGDVLARLTGYRLTRGILCAIRRPAAGTCTEVCEGARRVAVLDGITDQTNVGAIFRSAAALGIDAALLTPACCDPLSRRAARVSMGTVFQIPWARLTGGMDQLRDMGFKTAAMALADDSVSIDDAGLMAEEKLAIVLGAEGDGLASEVIHKCDYVVRIPMDHGVDSLNVAAASAVAFWQLRAPKG